MSGFTYNDLKILAVLIEDERERRVAARALRQKPKGIECRTKLEEEEFASTKTKQQENGGWKSPAQVASELLGH